MWHRQHPAGALWQVGGIGGGGEVQDAGDTCMPMANSSWSMARTINIVIILLIKINKTQIHPIKNPWGGQGEDCFLIVNVLIMGCIYQHTCHWCLITQPDSLESLAASCLFIKQPSGIPRNITGHLEWCVLESLEMAFSICETKFPFLGYKKLKFNTVNLLLKSFSALRQKKLLVHGVRKERKE